jgi:hypothetical protein
MMPKAGPKAPGLRPLVGMLRLARGRVDGLEQFGDTPQAFLSSLAPLLAFPIVGALLLLASDGPVKALATLLVTLVVQLAPAVLSHALARFWGREAAWTRYATAFNWCQWALPLAALALLVVLQAGMQIGLPEEAADAALLAGLGAYGLWLNWLLARHGLDLSRGRAALLVVATNLGTVLLVAGPGVVARALAA